MRTATALLTILLTAFLAPAAAADPDRDSLIEAWETRIATMPGTSRFDAVGDGVYQFEDTDLPYDGELTIVGALVRPAESAGYETGYSHIGMIDFRLDALPDERLSSQVYYYWLTDRQTLYFSTAEQRWVDTATFQQSLSYMYDSDDSFGALSFFLNYGFWIIMIIFFVFVYIGIEKQAKKARAIMDDTESINEKARKNIDRAEGLQDEILAIARETRDLQSESNALLKEMLDALKK